MFRGNIRHGPGLCHLSLAGGNTHHFPQHIVGPEQLLGAHVFAVIQGEFCLVQQVDIGFTEGVGNPVGNIQLPGHSAFTRSFRCYSFGNGTAAQQQAVIIVQPGLQHRLAALNGGGQRLGFAGEGVVQGDGIFALQADPQILEVGHVGMVGQAAVGQEEPLVFAVGAQLVDQIVGAGAGVVVNIHHADILQRFQNGVAGEIQSLAGFPQSLASGTGDGIGILGGIAQEDQLATVSCEGFQPFQGGGSQSFAAGNQNHIVGHLTHLQGSRGLGTLLGKQRFTDKVKINAAV